MDNNQKKSRLPALIKILIVLAIAGGAWWYWHGSGEKSKDKKSQAPIAITPVTHKDVPVYLNGLGTVQAYNTVTVRTQLDGQLVSVDFNEGQDVKAGDTLAKIDPRTYQATYDQVVANKAKDAALLENARRDLERYAHLGNSISQQTVDTQRATVHQDEAMVKADQAAIDSAHTTLSYTNITSPIDGRTGIRQVDNGNVIHTSDANGVVVVTQVQPISVIFSLPQQNFEEINEEMAKGQKLQVLATAADNATVLDTGVLELVDNQIDSTTGTIKLKSTFPNARRALWPGGFVNVRLLLTTRVNATVIPTVAVQRGPNNASYVFVYNADKGTVSMKTVKVAMAEGPDSVIDEGVSDGDQVVTDGMAKLQDGSKVTLADKDVGKDDKAADKTKPGDARPDDAPAYPDSGAKTDKPDEAGAKEHHHKRKDNEG